ncbi:uncharacterized protein LOC135104904 [Scylla paramamosain]|uniref:uncharacterized protein LOC135104904 n=1 Tax=Scylla paramamosain TaxID=85552 RepID=UPI003083D5A5
MVEHWWNATTECLRVAVLVFYPFIFMSEDGPPYKVTGSMKEVLDIIARKLSFCYEYVVPEDRQFGLKMTNGSWTGMIGILVRQVRLGSRVFTHGTTSPSHCW